MAKRCETCRFCLVDGDNVKCTLNPRWRDTQLDHYCGQHKLPAKSRTKKREA